MERPVSGTRSLCGPVSGLQPDCHPTGSSMLLRRGPGVSEGGPGDKPMRALSTITSVTGVGHGIAGIGGGPTRCGKSYVDQYERGPLRSGCQRLSDDTAADGTCLEPLAVQQSAFHNLEKNFKLTSRWESQTCTIISTYTGQMLTGAPLLVLNTLVTRRTAFITRRQMPTW